MKTHTNVVVEIPIVPEARENTTITLSTKDVDNNDDGRRLGSEFGSYLYSNCRASFYDGLRDFMKTH